MGETAGVILEAYRPENAESRDQFHVADLFDTLFEQYSVTISVIEEAMDRNDVLNAKSLQMY